MRLFGLIREFDEITLITGLAHMSLGRREWIEDFLKFVTLPATKLVARRELGFEDALGEASRKRTLYVFHEAPTSVAAQMTAGRKAWIDIRVSPVRFHDNDFILAIDSNDKALKRRIARCAMRDDVLMAEAESIRLALRYKDLGQSEIGPDAAIVFLEKTVCRDSIHYGKDERVTPFQDALKQAVAGHASIHYCDGGKKVGADELETLNAIGATPIACNLYSALSSSRVRTLVGVRTGVLQEAYYFGKNTVVLEGSTTPLARGRSVEIGKFNHIDATLVTDRCFWKFLLGRTLKRPTPPIPVRDLFRRAANEWNSYAPLR